MNNEKIDLLLIVQADLILIIIKISCTNEITIDDNNFTNIILSFNNLKYEYFEE
jgi:hypothetical protein